MTAHKRVQWIITGGVQGVGFRPFVYKSALNAQVCGTVGNTAEGVSIEVQGTPDALQAFATFFERDLPPLARIVSCTQKNIPPRQDENTFRILPSSGGSKHQVLISPDVATCEDCLADIKDTKNRRFQYPFTNCTNCGPRYTITHSIPYDRASTSMACFPLCPDCQKEYEEPLDRRFHAQPNACPLCGPKVWLTDQKGMQRHQEKEALQQAAVLLLQGKIVAIKGLGGFHLVCDAWDSSAVSLLRHRKNRQDKPLAVMVQNIESARHFVHMSPAEELLLSSRARPIVLLKRRPDCALATELSPDTDFLGLMLPYTPLHHILFTLLEPEKSQAALVMTSGNTSGQPICLGNREAVNALKDIADFFLLHNRDILIRCDDSVTRSIEGTPVFLRRSRGYTPAPIMLGDKKGPVLGVGAEQKSTFCLTKADQAFVSQHIGDLENMETLAFFSQTVAHLKSILKTQPVLTVHDLHPDYQSTRFAQDYGLPCIALQHHLAHIWAVLGEHQHSGPALGLALDGTGLGEDGTLWGGELFMVDTKKLTHTRMGRAAQVPLPGGDRAAREPWRMARAYLYSLGITQPNTRPWPWLLQYAQADAMVGQMLTQNINSPLSSSCGRLFDAVSAMLGISSQISYEGQAAIRLEARQDKHEKAAYPCPVREKNDIFLLDTRVLFSHVYADWNAGISPEKISSNFHQGLVCGLGKLCLEVSRRTGIKTIALSGGVFLNATLATALPGFLADHGLTPLMHQALPPGDACISLGQAVYGQHFLSTL